MVRVVIADLISMSTDGVPLPPSLGHTHLSRPVLEERSGHAVQEGNIAGPELPT